MSDRDDRYPASFRGVTFFVAGGDGLGGRRVQKHEFIGRDSAEPEDLGGLGGEFTIEAFILGDDIPRQRKRLEAAMNTEGPGQLVHPRRGVMNVQPGQYRWSFKRSTKETYILQFFPVPATPPGITADTAALLSEQCDAVLTAVDTDFNTTFNVSGPAAIADSAIELLQGATNTLRNINRQAQVATDTVATIDLSITDLMGEADSLIRAPLQFAGRVRGVIRNILNIDTDIDRAFDGYRSVETSWRDVPPVPGSTPSRVQQAANQAAMQRLFVATATVEAARFIATNAAAINITSNAQSPFASADDAYALRDELVVSLDAVAIESSDDTYREVQDVQAALATHLEAHGQSLPRVRTLTLNSTLPALVLAHQLYGDALRESDLITRNNLTHPLFVEAGTTLEILDAQ